MKPCPSLLRVLRALYMRKRIPKQAVNLLNFKMRLYPNEQQERHLEDALEINSIIYNYFVINKFRSRNDMNYALTELKEQLPGLRKYHSKMLQMISTKVAGALSANLANL
jgi:hypothetical protein